jgi:hypothetical protein
MEHRFYKYAWTLRLTPQADAELQHPQQASTIAYRRAYEFVKALAPGATIERLEWLEDSKAVHALISVSGDVDLERACAQRT